MTEAIVAGHICLDIIPTFPPHGATLTPGTLVKIGPATISTGGAVSNTGLALHRLGIATQLMGKVGDDLIGRAILDYIGEQLAAGMIVAQGETSSYTIVINPPGIDRTFLHCTGANDTFTAADVKFPPAKLFHFGYPTLMRSIYNDGGCEMEKIFRQAKAAGLTTSLDMSYPDPKSEAGQVDWLAWHKRVLPHVDIYLPSLDEMQLMLRTTAGAPEIARQLQAWGVKIAGLKMGDKGLFVRWEGRELHAPCFQVKVAGTTGAGDATIAGFLAGYLRNLSPEETMTLAAAVGACCCEKPDATTGIRTWDETRHRIAAGWPRLM
ncbi:MAG: 2-dehydro-3-deoxygluconokinase [Verrucomicrobiae bacterium]|nr:2-dehydro-3-deoxygluconokinase [Verrucomicrobiae bacterium]